MNEEEAVLLYKVCLLLYVSKKTHTKGSTKLIFLWASSLNIGLVLSKHDLKTILMRRSY